VYFYAIIIYRIMNVRLTIILLMVTLVDALVVTGPNSVNADPIPVCNNNYNYYPSIWDAITGKQTPLADHEERKIARVQDGLHTETKFAVDEMRTAMRQFKEIGSTVVADIKDAYIDAAAKLNETAMMKLLLTLTEENVLLREQNVLTKAQLNRTESTLNETLLIVKDIRVTVIRIDETTTTTLTLTERILLKVDAISSWFGLLFGPTYTHSFQKWVLIQVAIFVVHFMVSMDYKQLKAWCWCSLVWVAILGLHGCVYCVDAFLSGLFDNSIVNFVFQVGASFASLFIYGLSIGALSCVESRCDSYKIRSCLEYLTSNFPRQPRVPRPATRNLVAASAPPLNYDELQTQAGNIDGSYIVTDANHAGRQVAYTPLPAAVFERPPREVPQPGLFTRLYTAVMSPVPQMIATPNVAPYIRKPKLGEVGYQG
jgi:hypothetical protein